jgi:hypothetical protein
MIDPGDWSKAQRVAIVAFSMILLVALAGKVLA